MKNCLKIFAQSKRLLWAGMVVGATAMSTWIILQSYRRYQANPTVVSLVKEHRNWNVTFPASTFCFIDKFDEDKAKALVKRKWNVQEGEKDYDLYMEFLKVLSNTSYYNILDFKPFEKDTRFDKENLTLLMDEVNYESIANLRPTLFNKESVLYFKTLMEFGLCYTVNALLPREYVLVKNSTPGLEPFTPQYCLFLNLACYGVTEHFKREIVFYVHSPYEVPQTTDKFYPVTLGSQRESNYNHLDIVASEEVKKLSPDQRHCYMYDEARYKGIPYYSFNICQMQCRKRLAMQFCKCVPHFYVNYEGHPQCTVRQLVTCIEDHREDIISLRKINAKNQTEKTCKCYQRCEEENYYFDWEEHTPAQFSHMSITKYKWGIDKYSKTRFRRDIIFGIEDLLVSFGGTVALFLGCSFMSTVELFYYFTLRLLRNCCNLKKAENNSVQKIQTRSYMEPSTPSLQLHSWRKAF